MHVSIRQLIALDAIVRKGGFKAAAEVLHRSHPSVMAAMKKLEEELGFALFDRGNYRTTLTPRGNEFYLAMQALLKEYAHLGNKVSTLQSGSEQQINVVIGDVTPPEIFADAVGYLHKAYPDLQINVLSENLMGPQERLFDGAAEIIFHHIDSCDTRVERLAMGAVTIVPVAAPGFLGRGLARNVSYGTLTDYVQCVIRCTASHSATRDYFVLEGSRKITVGDQFIKKHLILSGIAWGHMPEYLIRDELAAGRLISIASKNIREEKLEIVAARRRDAAHGAIAQRCWEALRNRPCISAVLP